MNAPPRQIHPVVHSPALDQSGDLAGSVRPGRGGEVNKHAMYEAAKRTWTRANPEATAEQYEAAMRAIARRYGV